MNRTEEQMVAMSPIEVVLGTDKYQVKPLRVLKQAEWRDKLFQDMRPLVLAFVENSSTPGAWKEGLATSLLESPKQLTEMLFTYATDLPRSKILEEATEEQVAVAFSAIMDVVFPFKTPLSRLTALMMKAESLR